MYGIVSDNKMIYIYAVLYNFVIKVADCGLSEDVYSWNYFRQVEGEEG